MKMGLDQYLEAERFFWDGYDENDTKLVKALTDQIYELKRSGRKVKKVVVEAAYWRKCNQIHNWFVENVQNQNDDCGRYYVGRDQLKDLIELIDKAIENKDASLLPTKSGFFFGNTDINEYYWDQLTYSRNVLDKALKDLFYSEGDWSFYYQSSW
jgi:hypothetical protein